MSDPVVVPRVDAEFMALIPPLTADEKALLEESLVREGCRDALVVWKAKNILLDGHTRLDICQRRGIEYRTVEVELPDREAAADWIDRNQLGRRNLTPSQMKELIGRRYNRAKKAVGAQPGNKSAAKQRDQTDPIVSGDTAERLAKEHCVSAPTVKRAGKFAEAVEKVKAVDPDIEQKVMAGTAPPKAVIVEAAKLVDEKPEAAKKVLDAPPKAKRPRSLKPKPKRGSLKNTNDLLSSLGEAKKIIDGVLDLKPEQSTLRAVTMLAAQIITTLQGFVSKLERS